MPLYAEATHIYKPGNKDEVRLVYRVRGGGESNRHQKSFSIGKYGIKECWRMATDSKNFINTTHRLPHDFLDPWASLKNWPRNTTTNSEEKHQNASASTMPLEEKYQNSENNHRVKGRPNNPEENLEGNGEHSKALLDSFYGISKKKRNVSEVEAENTHSDVEQQYENVNIPPRRNGTLLICEKAKSNPKPKMGWLDQRIEERDVCRINSSLLNGKFNTHSTNDPVLYMQLKKKRGRPPKWLQRFSPSEIQQMFKSKRETKSKGLLSSTTHFYPSELKGNDQNYRPNVYNYKEVAQEEMVVKKGFNPDSSGEKTLSALPLHARNINALLAAARVDWRAAKMIFEKCTLRSRELKME